MPELAAIRIESRGKCLVAHVEGEVDASNVGILRSELRGSVPNEVVGVVVDLRDVGYLDSSGIHLLVELTRTMGARGQRFRVVTAPDSFVAEVLELSGVLGIVPVDPTVESALESI